MGGRQLAENSASEIDGIYVGFMTGAEGSGFTMFVFLKGVIYGSDPLGVLFDGTYQRNEAGYFADVQVTVPGGGAVIQGASAGPSGMTYNVQFELPQDFETRDFVRVETPLGAVNLKLRKTRDLNL